MGKVETLDQLMEEFANVSIQDVMRDEIDPYWDTKMEKREGAKINTAIFSGKKEDWIMWSNRVQKSLIAQGLLFFAMYPKSEVLPEIMQQQKAKAERSGQKEIDLVKLRRMMQSAFITAHSYMTDGLSGLAQQHVKHIPPGEPYKVWQALSAGEYASQTTTSVASIRMTLFGLKMSNYPSFQEYVNTLREKQMLLAQANKAPADDDMKAILLLGMKEDSDRAYIVRACHGNDELNFEGCIKAIKSDIELQEAKNEDDPDVETTSFHVSQWKGGQTTGACGNCKCCTYMWTHGWRDVSWNNQGNGDWNQKNDWKKKSCHQWSDTGRCRFGDNCRFAHVGAGGESEVAGTRKVTCHNCGGKGHKFADCPSAHEEEKYSY